MPAAERQTRSRLMQMLQARGLNPRRDLGQNFLIDLNLIRLIVDEASLSARDVVLEIGAGTGSLTAELAQRAGAVVAVEYDRNLCVLAAETLSAYSNVTLLQQDALAGKHRIAPAILDAVAQRLRDTPDGRFKLVANFPYNIATPVVSNLVAGELPWERMVITIQLELAERMLAGPSSPHYGALSVWLQSQCDVVILRRLPPSVFWPRPKVDSAIVRITPSVEKRQRIRDLTFFHDYVRKVFQQRRKQIRRVLAEIHPDLNRQAAAELLAELRCREGVRAEELDVSTHVELSNRIGAKG